MVPENVPFEVLSDFPETGDLSTQVGGDVIDGAKSVRFKVENVEPQIVSDASGQKLTARLNVRASIGPLGVNGEGRYAGKNLFADLLTWYNESVYTSDWWKKQARFPYKSFLKAMGFDFASPPKVNDEFVIGLKGREFIADIQKREIRVKDEGGSYKGTGDFRNELSNFKKAE